MHMKSMKLFSISAISAAIWFGAACVPAGSAELQIEPTATYKPIQSIRYEFGSKFMSGYFVEKSDSCFVTLMVTEKSDPNHLLPFTAARIRLVMKPGQTAGLDSEEGLSLNLTCGNGAATLRVDAGERSKLMTLQAATIQKSVAEVP